LGDVRIWILIVAWAMAAALVRRAHRGIALSWDCKPSPPDLGPDLLLGAIGGLALAQGVVYGLVPRAADGWYARFFATHACLALLGTALVVGARRLGSTDFLGLSSRTFARGAAFGGLVYVLVLPAVLGIHHVNRGFLEDEEQLQDAMQQFLQRVYAGDRALPLAMTLILVVVVPLFEEVLFRGWLQSGLRSSLLGIVGEPGARMLAVVTASAIFTAVHPPFTWIPILFLGLLLGLLYEHTRSLWPGVVLHGVHNAFTLWYPVITAS